MVAPIAVRELEFIPYSLHLSEPGNRLVICEHCGSVIEHTRTQIHQNWHRALRRNGAELQREDYSEG